MNDGAEGRGRHLFVAGVLAVAALIGLLAGKAALAVVTAGAAILGAREVFDRQRLRGLRPVPLVGVGAIVGLFGIALATGEDAPRVFPFVVASATVACFGAIMLRKRIAGATESIVTTLLLVVVLGMLGAYVVVVRGLPLGVRFAAGLLSMVAATQGGSAAYAAWRRRRAGSHALARPAWETRVAGAVGCFAVAMVDVVVFAPAFDRGRALFLAAIVIIFVPLGELWVWMFRQDLAAEGEPLPEFPILARVAPVLTAAAPFFYAVRALIR